MDNERLPPVTTFYFRILKEFRHVLFILFVTTSAFLAGVESEFRYNLSKTIHVSYYDKLAATQQAQSFVNGAKNIIYAWSVYHANTNSIYNLRKIRDAESYSLIFKYIEYEKLDESWRVYAMYYYAYLQFICADLKESQSCLTNAQTSIEKLHFASQKALPEHARMFLVQNRMIENIEVLQAYSDALAYKLMPSERLMLKAIDSLNKLGGIRSLEDRDVKSDRLLGPVLRAIEERKELG